MGIVNTKSASVTNRDAAPPVQNLAATDGGFSRISVGTVEVAAADSDASVFRICRLPSNAVITSAIRYNDAITGATDYDLGFYQTAANGGAEADKDVLADGVDINAGTVAGVEHRFTTANIDGVGKRVWELLGLSADPNRDYDLCWTGNTVGSAAGTITTVVRWAT